VNVGAEGYVTVVYRLVLVGEGPGLPEGPLELEDPALVGFDGRSHVTTSAGRHL
jgi:hypothetical protein